MARSFFSAGPSVIFPPPDNQGGGAAAPHVHVQATPAAVWTVDHNLGRAPAVTTVVGGEQVDTDIAYPSVARVVAVFPSPMVGTLICN